MSANDRNILLAVPVIAALVAVWFLLLSPKQDDVKKLDAQVSALQSAVESQQQAITGGLQARKQFPSAYHRLVVTGKAVPVNDETASLLVQVDRAAAASGVVFQEINQGGSAGASGASSAAAPSAATGTAVSSESGLTTLPYALIFKGTFFQIADFISKIDRLVKPRGNRIASNGRLTTIDGFTLGPDDPRPLPNLIATVNVTTYLAGQAAAGAEISGSSAAPAASTTSTSTSAPTSSTSSTDSAGSTSATTASASASP